MDIIHSNMGSVLFGQYGTPQKIGHADFFPNGGSRQPACDVSLLKEYTIPRRGKLIFIQLPNQYLNHLFTQLTSFKFLVTVACNHLKAAEYFKRSVQGEVFKGCSCSTWTDYVNGTCGCSGSGSESLMGEYCDPS